jgi:glycosyltransferase involved in cell wall biosynthesis
MYLSKQIAVVVPAHNEEKLIGRVIQTMPGFVDRIYVVDDCSSDETRQEVRRLTEEAQFSGRVVLIEHASNQGVGGAIVTGYKRAIADQMDVVAVMAGDAQMAPDDLEQVIGPVVRDEADYVKGNRLFTGEAWTKIPRYRYLGNASLSLLTKIASGYWHIADSQTGYTAISREALETIPIRKLYRRYGYPNHLLVMLNVYNFRVCDVPVQPVYNIGEKSGIRLRIVIPRMSWLLLKQFLWRMKEKYVIRDFHPLLFFYAFGVVLFLACLGLSVRLFWKWGTTGIIPEINALACMFTAISGTQFLLFGMWFDMEYNRTLRWHPTSATPTSHSAYRRGIRQSTAASGRQAPQDADSMLAAKSDKITNASGPT